MTNLVTQFEQEQIAALTENKEIPEFSSGDTVRVSVRVTDGATERLQNYEGVVIAKSNRGITSSFTVRKVSHGLGVERKFMTYSPMINSVKVVKRGVVRRAKLYYLRNLSGKAARIKEKMEYHKTKNVAKNSPKAAAEATTKSEPKANVKDTAKTSTKEAPKKGADSKK